MRPLQYICVVSYYRFKKSIKESLFCIGVIVGRPKSFRAPFFTLTSKKQVLAFHSPF